MYLFFRLPSFNYKITVWFIIIDSIEILARQWDGLFTKYSFATHVCEYYVSLSIKTICSIMTDFKCKDDNVDLSPGGIREGVGGVLAKLPFLAK